MQLQQMKEVLSQLSLTSVEIHAHTIDCDIDGGSDSPILAYQDLLPGFDSELHSDLESNQYKLLSLISNRCAPNHVTFILFEHTLALK